MSDQHARCSNSGEIDSVEETRDVKCEVETLEHFLYECDALGEVRKRMDGVSVKEVLFYGEDLRCSHKHKCYILEYMEKAE